MVPLGQVADNATDGLLAAAGHQTVCAVFGALFAAELVVGVAAGALVQAEQVAQIVGRKMALDVLGE